MTRFKDIETLPREQLIEIIRQLEVELSTTRRSALTICRFIVGLK